MSEEREFAKQVKIEIKDVSFKMDRTGDKVEKVVLEVVDGNRITYKPKVTVEERFKGIKIIKETACALDQVPKRIMEIGAEVNSKGTATVLANYHIWNTTQDGMPATYRYIMGLKMLNEWSIVKDAPIETDNIVK